MNVGQEMAPSIKKDIDRSLMMREKVFFEAPVHCMQLDVGGVQEEAVRSQSLVENLSTHVLASESSEWVELEKDFENRRLHRARQMGLASCADIETLEQERERVNHGPPCVLQQALVAFASSQALYSDSGRALET